MARRIQLCIFSTILLIVCINSEKCIQKTPCSCEFEDGRKIDLKLLEEKGFITTVTANNLTFYFHACSDKKPTLPSTLNITENECQNTSLCLVQLQPVKDKNATATAKALDLGKAKDVKFTFGTNSEKSLVFDHNKNNITTIIHLVCTDYSDTVLDIKIDSNSKTTHNLILFSEAVCPFIEKKSGLSTGSVFVIILCTFSSVYLLGGAAVLHFLRGARGKEMIPNIEFWSGLPGLVRDGAIFLQNGCKPPIITTAESYDRI